VTLPAKQLGPEQWADPAALEEAAVVLKPCFDAVRDVFVEEFVPPDGGRLEKLRKTKLIVTPEVRDSPRHFAGFRDDGMQILIAPEAADLPLDTAVAILAHEFGHAADFAYPAHFRLVGRDQPAQYKPPRASKRVAQRIRAWEERGDDQIEWTADAIVHLVTGKRVGYCGPCLIQCFEGGRLRPKGLK